MRYCGNFNDTDVITISPAVLEAPFAVCSLVFAGHSERKMH